MNNHTELLSSREIQLLLHISKNRFDQWRALPHRNFPKPIGTKSQRTFFAGQWVQRKVLAWDKNDILLWANSHNWKGKSLHIF